MRRRILLAALISLGLACGARADATSPDAFAGHWRQVSSSAGRCATCTLTVSRDGTRYFVVASNGWEAQARRVPAAGLSAFAGDGRWERSPPRIDAGRRVAAHFVVDDGQLHLLLILTRPDGTPWRVLAVFEREVPVG